MSEKIPVAILGASGYGGVQLVRLLLEHPLVEITYIGGSGSVGQTFGDLYPHLAHRFNLPVENLAPEQVSERARIVFLSLPNGIACELAPHFLAKDCKVLDLSADYRFRQLSIYEQWYKTQRTDHDINYKAVYGLPELYGDQIATADLVGCPGCYPTASILPLIPLIKQGLIDLGTIVIDAKSGTSGGGRKAEINLLLAEASNSISAYGVANHRHTPEIEQICSAIAGQEVLVQFTPHLMPMVRGILATVYAKLRDPGLVAEDLITIYRSVYRHAPFVKILNKGIYPQTKWTVGTNLCYIGLQVDQRTGRVIAMSAIDNLMKGQASQAVQCMNIMMGWQETIGLPQLAFYP
ncbi:MAG: N-acetyl-gamma-glutamyl-phosphate reductase [Pseudanabaenaceae cyanobacterium]